MQTTTNFGLKKYEGTDKFNPLTVENANMDAVEAALTAIRNVSFYGATETKSGNQHSITRGNQNSNFFSYVATGVWNSGDVMTVDGTQVSVIATNGNEPAQGAIAIGSTVLAIKSGNVVTLLVSGGAGGDADTLEGHDAAYFATAAQMVSTTATASSASTVAQACATKLGGKSIWTGSEAEYEAITTKDANTLYFRY